jgi:hypothetical protein
MLSYIHMCNNIVQTNNSSGLYMKIVYYIFYNHLSDVFFLDELTLTCMHMHTEKLVKSWEVSCIINRQNIDTLSIPFRGADEDFSRISFSEDKNNFSSISFSSDNNNDSRSIGNNRGIIDGFIEQYHSRWSITLSFC